jgi:hypothetical protein
MRGGRDRNRLSRRIDTGRDATGVDGGEFLGEMRAERIGRIEERATAGRDLRNTPRATISRGASSPS